MNMGISGVNKQVKNVVKDVTTVSDCTVQGGWRELGCGEVHGSDR